ncbi:unnamed protein product [Phyllotreta striolata]|uniref:C2H2-type domain-containing protein n=1 Tax=Phyllotreta striolata TaxID=444603 RepID=A0A9N9U003_PHYSR|nr:unnamed protein product [Phyllotreta striolata]
MWGGKFYCPRCGKSYVRKQHVTRHVQYECGKEPTFECPFCPKKYRRSDVLQYHLRNSHAVRRPAYDFRHCSMYYKFKGNIRRHLKYECGKEATFSCHLCNFKCKRADYLRFHLNSKKHSNNAVNSVKQEPVKPEPAANRNPVPSPQQNYPTSDSVKPINTFARSFLGLARALLNGGAMKYLCHKCRKQYTHRSSLGRHLKLECGKPPQFSCTLCSSTFTQKSSLKSHLLCIHEDIVKNSWKFNH